MERGLVLFTRSRSRSPWDSYAYMRVRPPSTIKRNAPRESAAISLATKNDCEGEIAIAAKRNLKHHDALEPAPRYEL
ncbi:hypothetical protein NDU88_001813 [Pleurodeles waltl]|uniref:Uncharacterized protein n=1 Tax=Pleurodeles waltl TaxID=8319 RepID=A0AAV7NBX3_PLEWA|nr:hypothetical protein NDU88_001813 [Pleurodeles waltl]